MAKVLIHGGAWNAESQAVMKRERAATNRTCENLKIDKIAAIDIVETAVAAQELEEALDAGIGSAVQLDGRIRMDAGICDSEGHYGAVIQIEHVATPVRVARRLMDNGYHSILCGEGAQRYAAEHGFAPVSVFLPETFKEFLEARSRFPELSYAALVAEAENLDREKMSTVGAVAIDDQGRLAAACSTGGLSFGYPGRLGDTAVFGAGVYCSERVAAACTGEGDKMLRRLTARRVEDNFLKSGSLEQAVQEAVEDLMQAQKGYCGVIAVSHTGESAFAHSTAFMSCAGKAS